MPLSDQRAELGNKTPRVLFGRVAPPTSGRFCFVVLKPQSGKDVFPSHSGGSAVCVCQVARPHTSQWSYVTGRRRQEFRGRHSDTCRCVTWRLDLVGTLCSHRRERLLPAAGLVLRTLLTTSRQGSSGESGCLSSVRGAFGKIRANGHLLLSTWPRRSPPRACVQL